MAKRKKPRPQHFKATLRDCDWYYRLDVEVNEVTHAVEIRRLQPLVEAVAVIAKACKEAKARKPDALALRAINGPDGEPPAYAFDPLYEEDEKYEEIYGAKA